MSREFFGRAINKDKVMTTKSIKSLVENRFDLNVIKKFNESGNVKTTYDKLRTKWRDDTSFKGAGLNDVQSNILFPKEIEDKAARSCLDFHFENHFLPTMGDIQVDGYFRNIQKSMQFLDFNNLKTDAPLLIECSHHQSICSILYVLVTFLCKEFGYKKTFMMHQKEELEERLKCEKRILKNLHDVEFQLYAFNRIRSWYKEFKANVGVTSIIIYFGDFPANKKQNISSKVNKSNDEYLHLPSHLVSETISVKRLTAASKMAKNLGANHYLCNIDENQQVELIPADNAKLVCPIESWVFWPGLGSLYEV